MAYAGGTPKSGQWKEVGRPPYIQRFLDSLSGSSG